MMICSARSPRPYGSTRAGYLCSSRSSDLSTPDTPFTVSTGSPLTFLAVSAPSAATFFGAAMASPATFFGIAAASGAPSAAVFAAPPSVRAPAAVSAAPPSLTPWLIAPRSPTASCAARSSLASCALRSSTASRSIPVADDSIATPLLEKTTPSSHCLPKTRPRESRADGRALGSEPRVRRRRDAMKPACASRVLSLRLPHGLPPHEHHANSRRSVPARAGGGHRLGLPADRLLGSERHGDLRRRRRFCADGRRGGGERVPSRAVEAPMAARCRLRRPGAIAYLPSRLGAAGGGNRGRHTG